jgi:hypothetical protein
MKSILKFLVLTLLLTGISANATLTLAQSAGIQSTLDHFYSLVTSNCSLWIQAFKPQQGTFYQLKFGVVNGRENLLEFCANMQNSRKVQEFRQDGPYTRVFGNPDQVHVLVPALYLNDAPYVNSQYQFFVLERQRHIVENPEIEYYQIIQVSELLKRTSSQLTFPSN